MNVQQRWYQNDTVSITDIRCDIINNTEQLYSLREEWDSLYNRANKPYFTQSFEWNWCCWQTVSLKREEKLCCLVMRHHIVAVLIFPLVSNKTYHLFSVAHCLASVSTEYSNALIDAAWNAEALMALALQWLKNSHFCDAIEFTDTRADSALYAVLEKLPNTFIAASNAAPYITIANYKNWDDYYQQLSKNTRHNLSRRSKRLYELGKVSFELLGGDKPYQQELAWLVDTKSTWVVAKQLTWSPFNAEFVACITEILSHDSVQGQMRLCVLKLNDKPIAIQLLRIDQSRIEFVNNAHDPAHAMNSPAQIMMAHCIQSAFERQLLVDCCLGDTPAKRDWSSETCAIASYDLYCNFFGWLYFFIRNTHERIRIIKAKLLSSRLNLL